MSYRTLISNNSLRSSFSTPHLHINNIYSIVCLTYILFDKRTAVSQATLDIGSAARQASRTASDTWSHSLSGWPSLTDSEENRKERASTMVSNDKDKIKLCCVKNCGLKKLNVALACLFLRGKMEDPFISMWNVQLEELIQKDTLKMGRSSSSISEIKVI